MINYNDFLLLNDYSLIFMIECLQYDYFQPTVYSPALYPHPQKPSAPSKDSGTLEFIDGTLPLRELHDRTPVQSPNQNQYSASPVPKSMSSVWHYSTAS